MYLARLTVENFRLFGTIASGTHLHLEFNDHLNLIVGENDSGKSAVIDAIRLVLGTRDYEALRLSRDDFYLSPDGIRATDLRIECLFSMTEEDASGFLEWLDVSVDSEGTPSYYLRLWLEATRKESEGLERDISSAIKAGPASDPEGAIVDNEARNNLRATYLRPLRDAEKELAAKRSSRLSQILYYQSDISDKEDKTEIAGTLASIMAEANKNIREHPAIQQQITSLNTSYLQNLVLSNDPIQADIAISEPKLKNILEQLQLLLQDSNPSQENTRHGLGLNNVLFMSAELLMLGSAQSLPLSLLLVEEPEAHLHPQLQMRLMEFLKEQNRIQVIMTSHSPHLAANVALRCITIMSKGQSYPLAHGYTMLDESDYAFLERFLDVTKSNLFFARGVLIVEGDSEQILLPIIANLIQRPLSQFGVSIINVGHKGLFRYARIFQRRDNKTIRIPVACVADLDITPEKYQTLNQSDIDAQSEKLVARFKGAPVMTFVSPRWTLEHDLCLNGQYALVVHIAIQLAKASKNKTATLSSEEINLIISNSSNEYDIWVNDGVELSELANRIYEPLNKNQASKPEAAQYLVDLLIKMEFTAEEHREYLPKYLVEAIDYVTQQQ